MRVLHDYFDALRSRDWALLAKCVAEDVHRTGPYLDVVEGRQAYVAFLAEVIPSLPNYDLVVSRIRQTGSAAAVVELSEFTDVDGVRTEFPEVLLFEFDAGGAIRRVDVYIKQRRGPGR
jgi:hypothetical protein